MWWQRTPAVAVPTASGTCSAASWRSGGSHEEAPLPSRWALP
jgi:hypothetical protein